MIIVHKVKRDSTAPMMIQINNIIEVHPKDDGELWFKYWTPSDDLSTMGIRTCVISGTMEELSSEIARIKQGQIV